MLDGLIEEDIMPEPEEVAKNHIFWIMDDDEEDFEVNQESNEENPEFFYSALESSTRLWIRDK